MIEAFNPASFEIVVYAIGGNDDAITRRFKARATQWHDAAALSHDALASAIVRDRIDILFDLGGHSRNARLPVFARRPAPLQIAWSGYPGTTGLSAMDFLVGDRFQVPQEEDQYYSETVWRMPHDYIAYDPPRDAPETGPLPAGMDRPLTFAAFHIPTKINPVVAARWSRVLRDQPGSRIQFVYAGYENAELQARLLGWFEIEGIGPDRLIFEGRLPHHDLLARYGTEIDIALDSTPYSGGVTTLEALWMGVPVLTVPGATFAGRHATTHTTNAGFPEFVARDDEEFVALVRRLGDNRPALAAMRESMRARVAASPLCDASRFAEHLSQLLREAWRARCIKG